MSFRSAALMLALVFAGSAVAEDVKNLKKEIETHHAAGVRSMRDGKFSDAVLSFEKTLGATQKLYPNPKEPEEHLELAASFNSLGVALIQADAIDRAVAPLERAIEHYLLAYPTTKFPAGHSNIATGVMNLAVVHYRLGDHKRAIAQFERSLGMLRRLFPADKHPKGHPILLANLGNLAMLLTETGDQEAALARLDEALAIGAKLYNATDYPNGHPDMASTVNNRASVLLNMGETEKALAAYEQALAMRRKLYPTSEFPEGHPAVAQGLANVGFALEALGVYDKALAHYEQALAMRRRIYPVASYPHGHHELAESLNNLGLLMISLETPAKAIPLFEQSLAMRIKLYPANHPTIATAHNNLGLALHRMGKDAEAQTQYERCLSIQRQSYSKGDFPNGHPNVAITLYNLGRVANDGGRPEQSLQYYRDALSMLRALFPTSKFPVDHPEISRVRFQLGLVLMRLGRDNDAQEELRLAFGGLQKRLENALTVASESESLDMARTTASTRDAYLSAALRRPGTAAEAYESVWATKSIATRLGQIRRATARVQGNKFAAARDQLRAVNRRAEKVVLDARMPAAERDKELAALAEDRERWEKELAKSLPELQPKRIANTPAQLSKSLPPDSAFIDFLAYQKFEPAGGKSDLSETWSYCAFISTSGRSVVRVELGESAPVDAAVAVWRRAIDGRRDEHAAALKVRDLIWAKLADALPAGIRKLYIAPDGDLARIPWAALPGANRDRILLEEFEGGVAVVPHGPFLAEHWTKAPTSRRTGSVLAVGGLDYGASAWPALAGTRLEITAATRLAPEAVVLTKGDASPMRLLAELPKARWAHLATHGYFDEAALSKERKRQRDYTQSWRLGDQASESRPAAAKLPLAYTGLVLSNGEVVTALSLTDLELEQLQLAVLSACETGLGDMTDGEGVFGLARALHLAGCENVIASLWKVDDAATAALMAKFYHEMSVNKREPLAALREAQLTIYHHPDLIPDLAGERGAPKRTEAMAVKGAIPQAAKRADTKLWAAFVLSGIGR